MERRLEYGKGKGGRGKKGPGRTQGALLCFAIRTNEQPHHGIPAAHIIVGLVKK